MANTYRSVQHRRHHKRRSIYKRLFSEYKALSKHRGKQFTLDFSTFVGLIKSDCYICGSKPATKYSRINRNHNDIVLYYNGIDRLDSQKGYTADNVKPCCAVCNRMKMETTLTKFKKHIKRIAETGLLFKPRKAKLTE